MGNVELPLESEEAERDQEGEESSNEEDGGDSEDHIVVGSHIVLTVDGEDYYGIIIEFEDANKLVTIKEDGSGDEITGSQDKMFIEE